MRLLRLALLLILIAGEIGAAGVTVIRAERAFTGRDMLQNVCVVIEGERIRDIVPMEDFVPVEGSSVIDAAGATLAPGFIDSHVHILSMPLPYLSDVPRHGWGRIAEQASSQMPGNRRDLLQGGITTVIDMGAPVDGIARMAKDLAAGKIAGPDVYYGGPLFTAPGGHPAATIYRGQHSLIDTGTVQVSGVGSGLAKAADLRSKGVSFIKLVYDDGAFYGGRVPRLDLELARALAADAHANGLKVVAHVGAVESSFADMVGIGADAVEHCFAFGGSESVFREMAARGITFTPTLSIYGIYAPDALPRMQESVRRAFAAGVPIAAGTDFPSTRFMNAAEGYFSELALLEQAGLPRIEVLRAATEHAARKLGKEREVGSLAPGLLANLVLVQGDITQGDLSPARVQTVMLHGNVVFDERKPMAGLESRFSTSRIVVSPFAFADPVAGFSVGLSVLDFNLFGTGAAMNLSATYSFSNFLGADLSVSPPSPIPRTSLAAAMHFDTYPRRFFGRSNDSSLDQALVYGTTTVQASLASTTSFPGNLVLSTQLALDSRTATGLSPGAFPSLVGAAGGTTTMVGIEIARDTRDAPGSPWFGDREALSIGVSHPYIGSAYAFETLQADFRLFFSLAHGHVVASRLLYRQSFGEAPFYFLPDFGGSLVGRGYQPGRFIGSIGLTGQVEYRFPIWAILGGVLFLDVGQVRDDLLALTPDGFHLTAGPGIRLAFSDTSILAFDVGFNGEPLQREGWAVVFRYGHAF